MLFGAHQSIAGGVANAIVRGKKATCDTIQMFNKSSNQWRAKKLTQGYIDEFFRQIDETGVTAAWAMARSKTTQSSASLSILGLVGLS